MMLKPKEKNLLKELRKDCRKNHSQLGNDIGMTVSTVIIKVKWLTKYLSIHFVPFLNYAALHYYVHVSMVLRCNDRKKLIDFLENHPNMNTILRVNNNADFFVECIFRKMADLENLLEKLKENGVKNCQMYYIINELKNESFEDF